MKKLLLTFVLLKALNSNAMIANEPVSFSMEEINAITHQDGWQNPEFKEDRALLFLTHVVTQDVPQEKRQQIWQHIKVQARLFEQSTKHVKFELPTNANSIEIINFFKNQFQSFFFTVKEANEAPEIEKILLNVFLNKFIKNQSEENREIFIGIANGYFSDVKRNYFQFLLAKQSLMAHQNHEKQFQELQQAFVKMQTNTNALIALTEQTHEKEINDLKTIIQKIEEAHQLELQSLSNAMTTRFYIIADGQMVLQQTQQMLDTLILGLADVQLDLYRKSEDMAKYLNNFVRSQLELTLHLITQTNQEEKCGVFNDINFLNAYAICIEEKITILKKKLIFLSLHMNYQEITEDFNRIHQICEKFMISFVQFINNKKELLKKLENACEKEEEKSIEAPSETQEHDADAMPLDANS